MLSGSLSLQLEQAQSAQRLFCPAHALDVQQPCCTADDAPFLYRRGALRLRVQLTVSQQDSDHDCPGGLEGVFAASFSDVLDKLDVTSPKQNWHQHRGHTPQTRPAHAAHVQPRSR